MGTIQFTNEDKEFLVKYRELYHTAQQGYVRHLDRDVLQQYENIYQRVLDPKFILCYHCGDDRVNVVLRLHREYEKQESDAADLAAIEAESKGGQTTDNPEYQIEWQKKRTEAVAVVLAEVMNLRKAKPDHTEGIKNAAVFFVNELRILNEDYPGIDFSDIIPVDDARVVIEIATQGKQADPLALVAECDKPKNKGGRPPKAKPEHTTAQ